MARSRMGLSDWAVRLDRFTPNTMCFKLMQSFEDCLHLIDFGLL